ncbi:MAG: SpoIVB peptidase [Sulfobacillus acidophilus]|uniref:SpoIVB peptidase n=1 Tax=Sulfobacillus acidophilus TaxID=53633 RepID=A0A2T2WPL9_9FIRM|nr:MAG: SpoIVB peptidase [Sulfobacillus acidophilus]
MRSVWRRIVGLAGAALVLIAGTAAPAQRLYQFPQRLEIPAGQDVMVPWTRWLPLSVVNGNSRPLMIQSAADLDFYTPTSGHYLLHLRLFGWLPWRGLPVDVTKPIYAVPGGQSIGVVVHTRGLIVTNLTVIDDRGRLSDPAGAAGIERGDVIMRVDGRLATSVSLLRRRVARDGAQHRAVVLWVEGARAGRQRVVAPTWSTRTQSWRLGLAVQDRTSGVGTLTFFDPRTHRFTALGHSMTDGVTRRPIGILAGRAMGADIVGVVPASPSQPGQKVGVLAGPANISGVVTANGRLGIVGQLDHPPIWGPAQAMPVAFPDQVHVGPAEIVTVLHGQHPQMFQIEILKTAAQYSPSVKGLLFKVTDPRLMEQTGGIVQGMSGSPIIQSGRVVGAVTHVLVNRPWLGFGCYAYWMAQQSSYGLG